MRARFARVLEQYGQPMTLCRRGSSEAQETRAFLQPLLKEQEDPPMAVTPLGPVSAQRWLYIGQADMEIAIGDRISCGKARLVVQEALPVYWRDEVLYRRAILRWEKEAAE